MSVWVMVGILSKGKWGTMLDRHLAKLRMNRRENTYCIYLELEIVDKYQC